MLTLENEKLRKQLKETNRTLARAEEANQELRQDCEDFTETYKKIEELLKQNDYNSITNLKNKINTILADCNLNKYRVCK